MSRRVVFRDDAEEDLAGIVEWIAERASVATARGYADRIRRYCGRFDIFPKRGTMRDDLSPPGLRTIGFERRITIVFTLTDAEVVILRLFYGGRDWGRNFAPEDMGD